MQVLYKEYSNEDGYMFLFLRWLHVLHLPQFRVNSLCIYNQLMRHIERLFWINYKTTFIQNVLS